MDYQGKKPDACWHGVNMYRGPQLTWPHIRQIRNGEYEREEVETGLANLKPGDRIVEMGTGVGFVGTVFAKNIENIRIKAFEANPYLIPEIERTYAANTVTNCIELNNKIVVSGPQAPDKMSFPVQKNYLGSRLSEDENIIDAETISVETIPYEDIVQDFPHNVIVMDIEGGELSLLETMDLSHIDLVMIELHPKVYGVEGRDRCITLLKNAGFFLDNLSSAAEVYTFKKPHRAALPVRTEYLTKTLRPTSYTIDPQKNLLPNIKTFPNAALAKNPNSFGWVINASVYQHNRKHIDGAICWINHKLEGTRFRPYPLKKNHVPLKGRWLFGGRFNPHFGHFLTETLSRVWALDHISEKIDGVIFFPTTAITDDVAQSYFDNFSEVFDFNVPIKLADKFYVAEELIVPPQACGLDRLMYGSPEFRHFLQNRCKIEPKVDLPKKIYISRTGDINKNGRIFLGEPLLEHYLKKDGFEIFHPEQHSMKTQAEFYRSADIILGADSSAFHLVNYVARPQTKIGLIRRRTGVEVKQMAQQTNYFGINDVSVFESLGRLWAPSGIRRAGLELVAEVKFLELGKQLQNKGFIQDTSHWADVSEEDINTELLTVAQKSNADMRPVQSAHDRLSNFPQLADPEKGYQIFH